MAHPGLGVSIATSVRPTSDATLLAGLDAKKAQIGLYPRYTAIWRSMTRAEHLGPPTQNLLDELADRSVTPIVFLESVEDRADWPRFCADLLDGVYDAVLADFDQDDLIVRYDHEMNGKSFAWAGDPRLYIEVWKYVRSKVTCKLLWCPIGHSAANISSFPLYWPGSTYVDYIGFDRYVRQLPIRSIPKIWETPIAALRKLSGKPIIVAEFGILRGLPDRDLWLATLAQVTGVRAALYFDLDLTELFGVDWSTDAAMRDAMAVLLT